MREASTVASGWPGAHDTMHRRAPPRRPRVRRACARGTRAARAVDAHDAVGEQLRPFAARDVEAERRVADGLLVLVEFRDRERVDPELAARTCRGCTPRRARSGPPASSGTARARTRASGGPNRRSTGAGRRARCASSPRRGRSSRSRARTCPRRPSCRAGRRRSRVAGSCHAVIRSGARARAAAWISRRATSTGWRIASHNGHAAAAAIAIAAGDVAERVPAALEVGVREELRRNADPAMAASANSSARMLTARSATSESVAACARFVPAAIALRAFAMVRGGLRGRHARSSETPGEGVRAATPSPVVAKR